MHTPEPHLVALRRCVDKAEERANKSCLICRHFKLVDGGRAMRCTVHKEAHKVLYKLRRNYWGTAEQRADGCLDWDGEI